MIKKIIVFVVSIFSFVWIHRFFRFLDKYPVGWSTITSHTVGILLSFPFFVAYVLIGEKPENAYALTFLGAGAGTSFGWMLEDAKGDTARI